MILDAKYLDSVGAAMADEIFKQADDGEPKLKDSRKRSIARILRGNQAGKTPTVVRTHAAANQEPIKNCV